MRKHSSATRVLLALAGLALVTTVVLPAGSAVAAGGPKVKLSQSKGLAPGQGLTIAGTGMAGDSGQFLAECAPGATTAAQCDLATEVAIAADSKGHLTSPLSWTVLGPGSGLCGTAALGVKALTCGLGLVNGSASTQVATMSFPTYYLSLGDSYSVGYQPSPLPDGAATSGFTGVVAKKTKLTLENFGCGGATTLSLTAFTGVCGTPGSYGPPAIAGTQGPFAPGDSQESAVDSFVAGHPNQIGLITVSISGNDVTPCATASLTNPVNGATDPVSCVIAGITSVNANIGNLVNNLSTATGTTVPIVGITYPDVLLGLWECTLTGTPNVCSAGNPANPLITESVTVFQSYLNPALKAAYTAVPNGHFVDVTAATGAYGALSGTGLKLKNVPPYGKIPTPVASICTLTWYCQYGNIHANTKGYGAIGKLIDTELGL